MPSKTILEQFIRESNHIEGEDDLPIDEEALAKFLANDLTEENLHEYHKSVSWNQEWSGKYRDCDVFIWWKKAPSSFLLWNMMDDFLKWLSKLDARQAHNRFEMIHPYQDFNGRMGRAIWLHKCQDNYTGKLSFLHTYYYQTLSHLSK